MKIILEILLVIICINIIICIYFIIRNNRVGNFKIKMNNLCHDICIKNSQKLFESCSDLDIIENSIDNDNRIWRSINEIDYDKMLYNIKPLKPKYWFNKEQLEFINKK